MALPQQVIDRLTREPEKGPGWAFGMLLFGASVFAVMVVIYLGLTLGYEPVLNSQIAGLQKQIDSAAGTISADDQTNLVAFYSEITNVKTVLANHVTFSRFLSWLEANTEANVYYTSLNFSSQPGNTISLVGIAKTEADVNQQLAIFEAAPAVQSASISSLSLQTATGYWQFNVTLTVDPSAVLRISP